MSRPEGPRASPIGGGLTLRRRQWLVVVPALFLGYLFVYPLVRILTIGLGVGRWNAVAETLTSSTTHGVLWFTVWQAVASTLLTVAVGIPGAWAVSRLGLTRSRWFLAVTTVPFVLPTVVVGVAFTQLVAGTGFEHSATAVVAAHAFYNVTIVVRLVGVRWARLGTRLEETARTLGAGPVTTFRRVTLPGIAPAIRAAASLTFLLSFTAFGTVLILGDLRLRTIEVEIWRQATQRLDFTAAATLAVLQLLVVGAALAWQERSSAPMRSATHETSHPARHRHVASGVLWGLGAMVTVPIWSLVSAVDVPSITALVGGEALGLPIGRSIVTSLAYASIATTIALAVGGATSVVIAAKGTVGSTIDRLVLLPLGTSAVTIGLGFLVALDWPIDLRASRALVPLAHALVAVPFVTRAMAPALAAIPQRLREAAATLGASPGQTWRRVEWPIVARAALVGGGFAFAISLGEFGATAFVARPSDPTLPLLVYRALGRPGMFGVAAAGSVALMVVTSVTVLLVDRFRTGEETL